MENTFLSKEFLEEIKKSKKYKNLSDDIIEEEIISFLKSSPQIKKINEQSIKKIKSKLHQIYSSYQTTKKNKIKKYFIELENLINNKKEITSLIEITKKILSLNRSSKERLNDYPIIYKKIFKITKKPKKIIDLGAGFNPFSYPFMKIKDLEYYAYDINNEDISILNEYFNLMKTYGLNGKAEILNIKNLEKIENLPNSDIIFLWKILEIIDKKNIKEKLIKILLKKTKFLIISFPTKTLSQKNMNYPERKGFEKMLKLMNLKCKKLFFSNEIFYIIKS